MISYPSGIAPLAEPRTPPEVTRFGMWIFLAAELMFFGALFEAYLVLRLQYPEGFAEASRHTRVMLGTMNTAVLMTSSLTMALAVRSTELDARRATIGHLLLTLGLGLLFVGIKILEYYLDCADQLVPGGTFWRHSGPHAQAAQLFFCLYFVMTGLHALHLTIGIVMVAIITWLVRCGPLAARATSLEATGLYWHLIDVIWIFLYPLLYLVAHP